MSCCGERSTESKWSWLVCICASLGIALSLGFALTFGVYQPVLMEYFHENKETTSRAGSITIAFILFSGPFAVFLTDRFGHRAVAMTCGFICSLSLITSSFVNHVTILYVSYSVLFGLSSGIIVNICYTVTRMYFTKHWPLATGLVTSGSNIGLLILTQCNELLIEAIGWRNSFRVMSGAVFFICIAAATFQPISNQNKEIISNQKEYELEEKKGPKNKTSYQEVVFKRGEIELNIEETEEVADDCQNTLIDKEQQLHHVSSQKADLQENTITTLNREEVLIQEHRRENQNIKRKMTWKDVCSLFKNITFVVGLISCFLANFGIYSPHIHLVQFAKDLDISSSEAAQFYIYFAVSNIISRIVIGQAVNKLKFSPFIALQMSMLVSGLAVIFLSFAKKYVHFVVFGIVYGAANGCFIVLHVLFFMSVAGPEKSGLSLGVAYMSFSPAVATGPPFTGYLADELGSYVTSFFVIGGIMVFASVLPLILCIHNFLRKRFTN